MSTSGRFSNFSAMVARISGKPITFAKSDIVAERAEEAAQRKADRAADRAG